PPGRSRRGGGIRRGLPGAARTGGAGIPLCRRPLMTPRLTALLAAALVVGTFGATPTTTKPSLAERLGFSATDIVLIVNGDDVGVSHAANMATIASLERGLMTSATITVPCPWFPEIAQYAREHPEADFGLHLVHTSEWKAMK